ncbi:hypothetical protein ACVW0P_003172 [Mucilaginibacter sp. UYNi724]
MTYIKINNNTDYSNLYLNNKQVFVDVTRHNN